MKEQIFLNDNVYLFACRDMELRRTNILLFENNTAHSYSNFGLSIIRELGPLHSIVGCSVYSPRVNPLNRHSDYEPIKLGKYNGKFQHILCKHMEKQ